MGCICFSPLDQGILTSKYLDDMPADSRAAKLDNQFHWGDKVTQERIAKVRKLNLIAQEREQSMAQMAIAWTLLNPAITGAIVGLRKPDQVDGVIHAGGIGLSPDQAARISRFLAEN